jgi:hypothetical protein
VPPFGKVAVFKKRQENYDYIAALERAVRMDYSKEIQVFKKFGVALVTNPGVCVYHNTGLDTWPYVQGPIFSYGSVTANTAYNFIIN